MRFYNAKKLIMSASLIAIALMASFSSLPQNGINYMVLVNKTHPLPDGWEEMLETVHTTNSVGDDVEVEKK
ncbi:MAG: hypothetical protein IJF90_11440, partial [Synergistaceae bacterium]|nr:hypothetical protein [Synergistaceae bacterium]